MKTAKEAKHRGRVIEEEVTVSVDPSRVWQSWADPRGIEGWFVDEAQGEARAGSQLTWKWKGFSHVDAQTVLDAVPGERLLLGRPSPDFDHSLLEVTIAKKQGDTVVRLVHSGFSESADWDEEYEGIVSGWHLALRVLKHYLENHFGRPRTNLIVMQPAAYEYAALRPWFRDEDKLSRWLCRSGRIGREGDRCRLALHDGSVLTGSVLASTPREALVSWEEMKAVLALKAFNLGPQRMLCLQMCSWDPPEGRVIEVQRWLQESVERLQNLQA